MPWANTSLNIWAFTFLCTCIWHAYQGCYAFGVNYWQSSCEKLSGAVSHGHSTGSRAHRWRQYLNPNCTERTGTPVALLGHQQPIDLLYHLGDIWLDAENLFSSQTGLMVSTLLMGDQRGSRSKAFQWILMCILVGCMKMIQMSRGARIASGVI